jgi:hypothetical protein
VGARALGLLHLRTAPPPAWLRGDVRDDIAPAELAAYCMHALAAAGTLRTAAAVGRLVTVTLAGLRPGPTAPAARG